MLADPWCFPPAPDAIARCKTDLERSSLPHLSARSPSYMVEHWTDEKVKLWVISEVGLARSYTWPYVAWNKFLGMPPSHLGSVRT